MKNCVQVIRWILILALCSCLMACGGDESTGSETEQGTPTITSAFEDPALTGGVVSGVEDGNDNPTPTVQAGTPTNAPTQEPTPTVTPEDTGLPQLFLTTEGGVAITSKETYVSGTFSLKSEAYEDGQLYDGAMEIRGRGNSTWMAAKKPYRIKLDKKADLLGMGESKHWVLLANYYDTTLMRNRIAFDTARAMDFMVMDSVNVDVYLNGEYQGNYQLCEQVRVAGERVNIYDWEKQAETVAKALCKEYAELVTEENALEDAMVEDLSWLSTGAVTYGGTTYDVQAYVERLPELTGGFLIELDDTYDEVSKFRTQSGQPIMVKAPEYAATNDAMFGYIREYIQAVESAIMSPDGTTQWQGETVHYEDLIDVDSFVDFFLLTEVFANLDSMFKSTYMYKDVGGKLTMGPLWDFDLCAGGSMVIEFTEYYDKWQTTYRSLSTAQGNQWYRYLIKDPAFVEKVHVRYMELRKTLLEDIVKDGGSIDTYEALLAVSGQKNFEMWGSGSMFGGGFGGGWGGWNGSSSGGAEVMQAAGDSYGAWGDWPDGDWTGGDWPGGNWNGEDWPGGDWTGGWNGDWEGAWNGGFGGGFGTTGAQSYAESVETLRTWMNNRLAWLDKQMTDVETLQASLGGAAK